MKEKQNVWPDYENFDHQLFVASTPFSGAYIHGMMTAMLCVGMHPWQQIGELMQAEIPALGQQGTLSELFNALLACTQSELVDASKSLGLMLPSEEETVGARLEAVSSWCEGFLDGIAKSNVSVQLINDAIVKEVLADFEQIKDVSYEVTDDEESEKDLTEIIEFIRVSILLIYSTAKQTQINAKQLH